jgi:hypothetical protein
VLSVVTIKPQSVPLTATGSKGPTNPSAQTCSLSCSKNKNTGEWSICVCGPLDLFEPLVGTLGLITAGDTMISLYLSWVPQNIITRHRTCNVIAVFVLMDTSHVYGIHFFFVQDSVWYLLCGRRVNANSKARKDD